MGTSEIYAAVETLPEIQDSIIVNVDLPNSRSFMQLFIVLKEGYECDVALKVRINQTIRSQFSPRHVPDAIYPTQQVRYILTYKNMEVPVRKIIYETEEEKAANRDAMANPTALDYFIDVHRKEMPQRM